MSRAAAARRRLRTRALASSARFAVVASMCMLGCRSSAPATQPPTFPVPAPTVARGGTYGLEARRLPAVSIAGDRLVLAFRESDGERGMPNLTLVVKDRNLRELSRHVVLSLAEADTMLDDADGKNPALDKRVARANAWLAEVHRTEHLFAIDQPIEVRATDDRIGVLDGTRFVANVEMHKPVTRGSDDCQLSPRVSRAVGDRVRRVAVVTIAWDIVGGNCSSPSDHDHIILW